jgi:PDDEXK-like domain of unknown function (DUF3799)
MSDLCVRMPAQPITKPGIYSMSHDDYLADPVFVPSLNASIAKVLIERSPLHARVAHPRFNAEIETDSTEEQDLGTAAHAWFLRGEQSVEVLDVADFKTKAARQQRDDARLAGKVPLKADRYDALTRMVTVLARFRAETGAFTDGTPERTLVWLDGTTWCRAKVDWLPHEPSSWLWDLKTVSGAATLRKWIRAAYDQQVDLQAVFHCRGSEFLHGEPPAGMNFCVIENKPPHGISVFSLGPMALEVGEAKARHAIRMWGQCLESDHWPGYPIAQQWVEPPTWVLREWQHLTTTGASVPQTRLPQADNLADRIIEEGNWGG